MHRIHEAHWENIIMATNQLGVKSHLPPVFSATVPETTAKRWHHSHSQINYSWAHLPWFHSSALHYNFMYSHPLSKTASEH